MKLWMISALVAGVVTGCGKPEGVSQSGVPASASPREPSPSTAPALTPTLATTPTQSKRPQLIRDLHSAISKLNLVKARRVRMIRDNLIEPKNPDIKPYVLNASKEFAKLTLSEQMSLAECSLKVNAGGEKVLNPEDLKVWRRYKSDSDLIMALMMVGLDEKASYRSGKEAGYPDEKVANSEWGILVAELNDEDRATATAIAGRVEVDGFDSLSNDDLRWFLEHPGVAWIARHHVKAAAEKLDK